MAEPLAAAALYRRLVAGHVRSQLQYRTSFALDVVGSMLTALLDFLGILVVFHNVPTLDGWSVEEIALLYGMSAFSFSIADIVIGHLDELPQMIREGSFDLLLLRPRGTLFQVVASDFELRRIGKSAQALAVLIYALAATDVAWTAARVAALAAAIPAGAAIFAAVWITAICIVFWVVEAREAVSAVTHGGQFLSHYPITIYDAWLRRFLAYVVPAAFVAYVPAAYVLGKPEALGLPGWLAFASPLVALVASAVAGATWRVAVRHYRSAGG